ncbi:hypothetical protein SAMN05421770_11351 [Granulicella rosea]|uniref:NHL repeat-containing protein n=1 Tax=Granulicella rosea TaxID=474952 RepID=A0A239MJX5_9BACT|nr:hypothetical protein [Granulicella rosea]SNT42382.1 hypothetical protein SAMN05421770_11351 [Granulicella rosea]
MDSYRKITRRILPCAALASVSLFPTGCGVGTAASSSSASTAIDGLQLQGGVHGGQQPISGGVIQLYEVGATGYSNAAKPLIAAKVTTASDGSFNITGDYTCDTGGYVYITASGGDAGAGANSAIALMAALGPCSSLSSKTYININEVTTVAAAYALAQFGRSTSFGTTLAAKAGSPASGSIAAVAPADNFATSATNLQGIANAMATAQVLASIGAGTSPGNNTNGSAAVEYWQVNTIADILAACVNSTGPTSTACAALFTNTAAINSSAPADTLQAALSLALSPALSSTAVTNLYQLITATAPFQPVADSTTGAVTDFTIGLTYTPVNPSTSAKVLSVPNQIVFDGVGNAWITNIGTGFPVAELDPTGNPVQAGSTANVYTVTGYNVGSTATSITGGASASIPYGIAIDTIGNAWVADKGGNAIFEIAGSGGIAGGANGGASTAVGYNLQTAGALAASAPTVLAIDGSNNIWFTLNGSTTTSGACGAYAAVSNHVLGEFAAGAYGTFVQGGYGGSNAYGIALDTGTLDTTTSSGTTSTIPGSSFVWTTAVSSGGVLDTSSHYGALGHYYTTTSGTTIKPGCSTPLSFISSTTAAQSTKIANNTVGGDTIYPFGNPFSIAFDHAGAAWVVNSNYNDSAASELYSVSKVTPGYGTAFTAAQASANFTFTNYNLSANVPTFGAEYLAIDGAGQVWLPGSYPSIVALSNTATLLSPATGFYGSVYTNGSTSNHRFSLASSNRGVGVDLAGNVWIANGSTSSGTVTVLVGAGVPVVSPLSVAVKNNTVGTMP